MRNSKLRLYDKKVGVGSHPGLQVKDVATSWAPTEIAALRCWLKADEGLSVSGGLVTSWTDQKSSYMFAQMTFPGGTLSNKPAYAAADVNGYGVVVFSASSVTWNGSVVESGNVNWLAATTSALSASYQSAACSIFAVSKFFSSTNCVDLAFQNGGATTHRLSGGCTSDVPARAFFGWKNGSYSGAGFNFTTNAYKMRSYLVGATGACDLRENGAVVRSLGALGTSNTSLTWSLLAGSSFSIGGGRFSGSSYSMRIAELLIFDGVLSGANLTNVESYLMTKFGFA